MALADVYQQALEHEYGYPRGWMANWPPGFDQTLGAIGRISDGKINRDSTLSDKGIEAAEDPDHGTPAGPWTFQSDKGIGFELGANASLPGWQWIGHAKGGLKIKFGDNQGVLLAVGGSHQVRLRDLDSLKPKLIKAAEQGAMEVGQAVIVARHVADSGFQATSQGQNAEFAATTSLDVSAAGLKSLASLAGDLNIYKNSHGVTTEMYPTGFTIAFRVLKLGTRGWWWWKRFTVLDQDLAWKRGEGLDEEAWLGDEDYFALLPSADEFH